MAQRRMFSKSITNSSQFLMMPQSSQNLYFHLGMNADDDGFCEHFSIMRMTDSKPDDLKVLQAKQFVTVFDDKVLVVTDWRENNYLRNDRYTPSKYLAIYKDELKRLSSGIPEGYQMDTQVRLGKVRLGKNTIAENAPLEEFSFKGGVQKLEESTRRDMNIIALYFDKKKPDLQSKEQFNAAIRRHLRPAKELISFTNEQILRGCEKAERQTPEWVLETVLKMLTK